jgi:hypothetical protein
MVGSVPKAALVALGWPRHQRRDSMASHYRLLALNLALSIVIMYLIMFSMIDGVGDFIPQSC